MGLTTWQLNDGALQSSSRKPRSLSIRTACNGLLGTNDTPIIQSVLFCVAQAHEVKEVYIRAEIRTLQWLSKHMYAAKDNDRMEVAGADWPQGYMFCLLLTWGFVAIKAVAEQTTASVLQNLALKVLRYHHATFIERKMRHSEEGCGSEGLQGLNLLTMSICLHGCEAHSHLHRFSWRSSNSLLRATFGIFARRGSSRLLVACSQLLGTTGLAADIGGRPWRGRLWNHRGSCKWHDVWPHGFSWPSGLQHEHLVLGKPSILS